MWYFEQRSILGRWIPCTQPDQPQGVTVSGRKLQLRAVTEVDPAYLRLTLSQLKAVYSPDGHLQAAGRDRTTKQKERTHE